MSYYAVARGRSVGIFMTWGDCEAQVKGFSGARYKKFDSAAGAENFIKTEGGPAPAPGTNNKNSQRSYAQKNVATGNNLKRTYSTSNNRQSNKNVTFDTSYSNTSSTFTENSDVEGDTDDSDDLGTVVVKQLDDIEKRLNKFGKGIDKIINKNKPKSSSRKTILIEPPKPKRAKSPNQFEMDKDGFVQVYTDGACSANGRKGARAGLGVFWGDGHFLNTSEPVSGRATNNCGEIQAATRAIKQALDNGVTKLAINTDSQFLINSVTKWMPGWKRKGWKLQSGEPVKNEIDFKELDNLQHKLQIKWNYVEAHRGIHGNEMADQLAKAGASQYEM